MFGVQRDAEQLYVCAITGASPLAAVAARGLGEPVGSGDAGLPGGLREGKALVPTLPPVDVDTDVASRMHVPDSAQVSNAVRTAVGFMKHETLKRTGLQVDGARGATPFIVACFFGHTDTAFELLALGAEPRLLTQGHSMPEFYEINAREIYTGFQAVEGASGLHVAVIMGNAALALKLVDEGVLPVNLLCGQGRRVSRNRLHAHNLCSPRSFRCAPLPACCCAHSRARRRASCA